MAAFLTASLVLALLVFSFSVSAGQRTITAEPGDKVILPCRAAENKDVIGVEWNRTDLESGHYVLAYRNSQFDPELQPPSFINRVDLLDVENGDVSLVLKNVKTDDTGTYECRAFERVKNRRKRSAVESISTIDLIVEAGNKEDGGNEDGGSWPRLIVGPTVCAGLVVLLGVAAVLYKKSRDSSLKSKRPPPAAADAEKKLTGPDE